MPILSFIGCGVSKFNLKDINVPSSSTTTTTTTTTTTAYEASSFNQERNNNSANVVHCNNMDGNKEEQSNKFLVNQGGKTKNEWGFVKKVLGLNEKGRGTDRVVESRGIISGRKSVSLPINSENGLFLKEMGIREANLVKSAESKKQAVKEVMSDVEEDTQSTGDLEDTFREDSILDSAGSPSFRVYCVNNDLASDYDDEENGDDGKDCEPSEEIQKKSETKLSRKWRKARGLRSLLQIRAVSTGLMANSRCGTSSRNSITDDSTRKLVEKPK